MTGAPTLADRARRLDFVDGKAPAVCFFGLGLVPDSCWRLGGTATSCRGCHFVLTASLAVPYGLWAQVAPWSWQYLLVGS